MTGDPLDDLFHGCALAAYLEVRAETRQDPPDSGAVKRRAYRYYEEELAATRALDTGQAAVGTGVRRAADT